MKVLDLEHCLPQIFLTCFCVHLYGASSINYVSVPFKIKRLSYKRTFKVKGAIHSKQQYICFIGCSFSKVSQKYFLRITKSPEHKRIRVDTLMERKKTITDKRSTLITFSKFHSSQMKSILTAKMFNPWKLLNTWKLRISRQWLNENEEGICLAVWFSLDHLQTLCYVLLTSWASWSHKLSPKRSIANIKRNSTN